MEYRKDLYDAVDKFFMDIVIPYGTTAAEAGQLELNAFEPLIADCLLESIHLLTKAVSIFRTSCVEGLEVRQDQCLKHLQESASFGAAYISTLGYDTVSRVIKEHKQAKVLSLRTCRMPMDKVWMITQ